MRKPFVAGNWKLNGSRKMVLELAELIANEKPVDVDVALCPPFLYIELLAANFRSDFRIGGQDVSVHTKGAFTGEVAAEMLTDVGASCVIIGHSERRQYFSESNETIALKTQAALRAGLTPIVCVGEQLSERESDIAEYVVENQLQKVLNSLSRDQLSQLIIAYEPVWAIGTGRTASAEQAQSMHSFIRSVLAKTDATIARSIRILYGGSVKPDNAAQLFLQPDIDGGLIGGAALVAADFIAICHAASHE